MPLNTYHPHHFNTTNFHLHGSHVSPDGIADNVMRSMEPGQSYDVEIPIPATTRAVRTGITRIIMGAADIQIASAWRVR